MRTWNLSCIVISPTLLLGVTLGVIMMVVHRMMTMVMVVVMDSAWMIGDVGVWHIGGLRYCGEKSCLAGVELRSLIGHCVVMAVQFGIISLRRRGHELYSSCSGNTQLTCIEIHQQHISFCQQQSLARSTPDSI